MDPSFFEKMTGRKPENIKVPTSPLLTYLAEKAKPPADKSLEHGHMCVQGHPLWADAHGIMLDQDISPREKWKMLHDYKNHTYRSGSLASTVKVGVWDANPDAALRCARELMQADSEMKSDPAILEEVQKKWAEWAAHSDWEGVPPSPRQAEAARINLESLLEVTRGFLKANIPLGPAFEEYKAKIPALRILEKE